MRVQGSPEELEIRCVSEQATVKHGIVWQMPLGPEPALLVGRPLLGLQGVDRVHRADLDRAVPGQNRAHLLGYLGCQQFAPFLFRAKCFRVRRIRHDQLMLESFLGYLERHGTGQDFLAVLAGNHPTYRETATITDPLDLVVDGHVLIAGAQKVGMKGVAKATFNSSAGRHQRLTKNLPAKHVWKAQILAVPLEMVVTDGREIQQLHQFLGYLKHACSCDFVSTRRSFLPQAAKFRNEKPSPAKRKQPRGIGAADWSPANQPCIGGTSLDRACFSMA